MDVSIQWGSAVGETALGLLRSQLRYESLQELARMASGLRARYNVQGVTKTSTRNGTNRIRRSLLPRTGRTVYPVAGAGHSLEVQPTTMERQTTKLAFLHRVHQAARFVRHTHLRLEEQIVASRPTQRSHSAAAAISNVDLNITRTSVLFNLWLCSVFRP